MKKLTEDQENFARGKVIEAIMEVGSATALAKEIGLTAGAICNWVNGRTIPSMENAARIEKVTDGKIKWEEIRPDIAL